MKLRQVLSQVNQVERSKFINCLDKICSSATMSDPKLAKRLAKVDGELRSASGGEITALFNAVSEHYADYLREQISLGGSQMALLVNVLSRDGHCIARVSWIEQLFTKEFQRLLDLSINIKNEIELSGECEGYERAKRLKIYKDCCHMAFHNDLRLNREAKITDGERMVLNVLAEHLGMSRDEAFAIEHLINPSQANNVQDSLNALREVGLLFINKKRQEVLVPDEVVSILHKIQNNDLPNKFVIRILRSLTDPELSNVLRNHGQKIRGVSREEKIHYISHSGLSIRNILSHDIFGGSETLNKRKERIKGVIEDLDINVVRLGTTLEERIEIVISSLQDNVDTEFSILSVSGFSSLIESLKTTVPSVLERIRNEFEIEEFETLDPDRLRALSISPLDILNLYSNEEIRVIRDDMGLSKRGNSRKVMLDSFASANDKFIENYGLLARRDMSGLAAYGIEIKEADLGSKFEEITKTMLEQLGLIVDEDLRKQINTAKDKADILLSIGGDDVIVGEVKSFKNGQFSKYSTTSRQVKAYANRCEANGRRVAQVLIIAPSFSDDFVEAAEMDTDVNISLLEADGLKHILDSFKQKRNPTFSPKLLTKGGLLKADLIAKTL